MSKNNQPTPAAPLATDEVEVLIHESPDELKVEIVQVNGKEFRIARGEPTMVPRYVKDILLQAGLIRR